MKTLFPDPWHEALYGGDTPSSRSVQAWFKKVGLTLPVNIVAIDLEDHDPNALKLTASKLRTCVVDSDRNMLYVMYNGSPEIMEQLCAKQSLLHSESFVCKNAGQWMSLLRRAIISVRQRYLSRLPDAHPEHFSLAIEQEHRAIAIKAFQRDEDWRQSVMLWLDISLIRKHGNLSNLRRKIVTFLSLATEDIDQNDRFSFLYMTAVRRILTTYAFSDYRAIVPQILATLHPYVILDSAYRVLSRHSYPEPIRKALAMIQKAYTTPIGLADISAHCFISRAYLARLFKHETGYTVTEFLWLLRIDNAKQLLIESEKGILEIALESGFNTVEHFHRVFKQHTNLTPSRYRKAHQHTKR